MQLAAKQVRKKFEQGDSTKEAAMEAEAQYDLAKVTYKNAFNEFKLKQNYFEKITRISPSSIVSKNLESVAITLINEIEKSIVWENIREASIELKMSKFLERMQLERVRLAESNHKPTLDLLIAINIAQNDATSTQGYQYKNKQLGLQYNLPIYSGGGSAAGVSQAILAYQSSTYEYIALEAKLENDFENNWSQLLNAKIKEKALNDALHSVQEQVKAVNRSIELGVKSQSESSPVQMNLAKRKVEVISLRQDLLKLLYKIRKLNIQEF